MDGLTKLKVDTSNINEILIFFYDEIMKNKKDISYINSSLFEIQKHENLKELSKNFNEFMDETNSRMNFFNSQVSSLYHSFQQHQETLNSKVLSFHDDLSQQFSSKVKDLQNQLETLSYLPSNFSILSQKFNVAFSSDKESERMLKQKENDAMLTSLNQQISNIKQEQRSLLKRIKQAEVRLANLGVHNSKGGISSKYANSSIGFINKNPSPENSLIPNKELTNSQTAQIRHTNNQKQPISSNLSSFSPSVQIENNQFNESKFIDNIDKEEIVLETKLVNSSRSVESSISNINQESHPEEEHSVELISERDIISNEDELQNQDKHPLSNSEEEENKNDENFQSSEIKQDNDISDPNSNDQQSDSKQYSTLSDITPFNQTSNIDVFSPKNPAIKIEPKDEANPEIKDNKNSSNKGVVIKLADDISSLLNETNQKYSESNQNSQQKKVELSPLKIPPKENNITNSSARSKSSRSNKSAYFDAPISSSNSQLSSRRSSHLNSHNNPKTNQQKTSQVNGQKNLYLSSTIPYQQKSSSSIHISQKIYKKSPNIIGEFSDFENSESENKNSYEGQIRELRGIISKLGEQISLLKTKNSNSEKLLQKKSDTKDQSMNLYTEMKIDQFQKQILNLRDLIDETNNKFNDYATKREIEELLLGLSEPNNDTSIGLNSFKCLACGHEKHSIVRETQFDVFAPQENPEQHCAKVTLLIGENGSTKSSNDYKGQRSKTSIW